MYICTFGSLSVIQRSTPGPSRRPASAANREKRSGKSGAATPPRSAIQSGRVKCRSVTAGVIPASRSCRTRSPYRAHASSFQAPSCGSSRLHSIEKR